MQEKCRKEGGKGGKSVVVLDEGVGGMVYGGVRNSVGGWKT